MSCFWIIWRGWVRQLWDRVARRMRRSQWTSTHLRSGRGLAIVHPLRRPLQHNLSPRHHLYQRGRQAPPNGHRLVLTRKRNHSRSCIHPNLRRRARWLSSHGRPPLCLCQHQHILPHACPQLPSPGWCPPQLPRLTPRRECLHLTPCSAGSLHSHFQKLTASRLSVRPRQPYRVDINSSSRNYMDHMRCLLDQHKRSYLAQ